MTPDALAFARSPSTTGMVLATDRLRVEIATPGTVYRGARFDWTGLITQVTLDGQHTFCVSEGTHATSTGGIGLCNEFGIFHPVGYHDAAIGEQFPKLGVGLLTRLDGSDYRFNRRYPIDPFPVQVNQRDQEVEFIVQPVDCRGYAARLAKRVSVRGTELTVAYELTNTGTRRLATREYNHNFLGIDAHAVGRDYAVHLPCKLEIEGCLLAQDTEGTVTWQQRPKEPFYVRSDADLEGATSWMLEHRPSGLWVTEQTSRPWRVFALYGSPRIISPEAFLTINLDAGEHMQWTRRYTFGCENDPTPA